MGVGEVVEVRHTQALRFSGLSRWSLLLRGRQRSRRCLYGVPVVKPGVLMAGVFMSALLIPELLSILLYVLLLGELVLSAKLLSAKLLCTMMLADLLLADVLLAPRRGRPVRSLSLYRYRIDPISLL